MESAHHRALQLMLHALGSCQQAWALTGSCGMALQGVPLAVHDIDVQSTRRGVYELAELLSEHITTPVRYLASARVRSFLGSALVGSVQVELIGDIEKRLPDGTWDRPPQLKKVIRHVEYRGWRVPVLDLHYEEQAYRKLGRTERADLLLQWINRHRLSDA